MKYLHSVGSHVYYLDHRIVPEVRAMLAAMVSRLPAGGITQRYAEVVTAVVKGFTDEERQAGICPEDRLTRYPLPPQVKVFFDDFVGRYGHSSILELVGSPTVFVEGISWATCWMLFDSPLCAGQEFSTRAVRHKDWPMAAECSYIKEMSREVVATERDESWWITKLIPGPTYTEWDVHPALAALHEGWLAIYDAEVEWWKDHLSVKANRDALNIGDKEPFRPAFDRARWALPGTIATGCAHATNLRERVRTLKSASSVLASSDSGMALVEDILRAYDEALPGMAGMGGREAVYGESGDTPHHLALFLQEVDVVGKDVEVVVAHLGDVQDVPRRRSSKSYADPSLNALVRVGLRIRCSIAAARDWHRHRTSYPWCMRVDPGTIDHHYSPMSALARETVPLLLIESRRVYQRFMDAGSVLTAACALPLGTRVELTASGGLRDVLYMLELRQNAHGACFEYKDQATNLLSELRQKLSPDVLRLITIES